MSSSIHYKFRAQNTYAILPFEGASISVTEAKRSICQIEGIRAELFDLELFNSSSNKLYVEEDVILRNSTVVIRRVPLKDNGKAPKFGHPDDDALHSIRKAVPKSAAYINDEEFSKMTEDERFKHIMHQSTYKYDPSNYKSRPSLPQYPAPPDFLCKRCYQLGHYQKFCPLVNVRFSSGFTNCELMDTTADDPQAMLHRSGRFVIPIMHFRERELRKRMDEQKGVETLKPTDQNMSEQKIIPPELSCRICKDLCKEALIADCCGASFCADCIQEYMKALISDDVACVCPVCKKSLCADSLYPNNVLREAVKKHKSLVPISSEVCSDVSFCSTPEKITCDSPVSHFSSRRSSATSSDLSGNLITLSKESGLSSVSSDFPLLRMPTVNLSAIWTSRTGSTTSSTTSSIVAPGSMKSSFSSVSNDVRNNSDRYQSSMFAFDERDKEAMDIAWDTIDCGDNTLDISTLLEERRTAWLPPPTDAALLRAQGNRKTQNRRRCRDRAKRNHRIREYERSRQRFRSPPPRRRVNMYYDKGRQSDRKYSRKYAVKAENKMENKRNRKVKTAKKEAPKVSALCKKYPVSRPYSTTRPEKKEMQYEPRNYRHSKSRFIRSYGDGRRERPNSRYPPFLSYPNSCAIATIPRRMRHE